MAWVKVDDKLHDHRKIRTAGTSAMGLWLLAASWSADNLTDGFVPETVLRRWEHNHRRYAEKLVSAELWTAETVAGETGYQFHDWADWQPTAADVRIRREEARQRMADMRASKKARSENVRANIERSSQNVRSPRPDQNPKEEQMHDLPASKPGPSPGDAMPDIPRDDVRTICEHLADRIEGNGSKRPVITQGWLREARLLIDNDGRTVDQVLKAIDWSQSDSFWRINILSMPKLREKFDQLRLAAQKENVTPARGPRYVGGPGLMRMEQ